MLTHFSMNSSFSTCVPISRRTSSAHFTDEVRQAYEELGVQAVPRRRRHHSHGVRRMRRASSQNAIEPACNPCRPRFQVTLPNPYYFPTGPLQCARHQFIARNVAIEFGQPKFTSTLWNVGKLAGSMTVPETPVHENCHTLAAEDEVWFAKQFLTPPPARNVVVLQQGDQTHLGGTIATSTNLGHHLGAFC